MLDGVLEASVAPPESDKPKSDASGSTSPLVLNISFIVTAIVALVAAKETDEISGATVSYTS